MAAALSMSIPTIPKLSKRDRAIIAEVAKADEALLLTELEAEFGSVDDRLDDLYPYLRRVHLPGAPIYGGEPNGVVLTLAGEELAMGLEWLPNEQDRQTTGLEVG